LKGSKREKYDEEALVLGSENKKERQKGASFHLTKGNCFLLKRFVVPFLTEEGEVKK